MEFNFVLIGVATLAQFILGAVWYSRFLFGRKWMEILEYNHLSQDEFKKMQKEMGPFYAVQLLLTVLFTSVLAMMVHYLNLAQVGFHAYGVAGWVWLGFVLPTQISAVIWSTRIQRKFWLTQIIIMSSYQLVGIMLAAFILSF